MDCLLHLNSLLLSTIDDVKQIYLPTSLALAALYFPIFLLSIFNRSISKISKWILTIPIVIYLLIIPTCQPFCHIPLFNTCIASFGIYYAEKICEWFLIRRKEFHRWSFFDIHHELFYYRVYTLPISIKKLKKKKKKKEIIFSGPIHYDKHFISLIYISCRIIQYYLLFDLVIFFINEAFSTEFYQKYYKKFLFIQIIVNQSSGFIVYLLFALNYDILRYVLCLIFNRPLKLMPELFQQPYRAISPADFWSRWHQVFKNTWIEIIFKPISKFILYYWPCSPKFIVNGISSMCVFLFSGIVHEYYTYVAFEKFSGDQIIFFLLHGLAVCIEYLFKRQFHQVYIPKSIGFLLTFIFNGITAGYFMQPWISYFVKRQAFKYSLMNLIVRILSDKY
ncbi:unnamed protein product [Rotaria sp. Silwood2]|nr:unnamed protein product [Rotaria sp. Silwood2]CAF3210445.1 unnamed protein product [Rotaria sp. Silwood2]CAF4374984.1 unnamed protein product [Rotaria sp. Silwood2]CAF4393503.1 unnamed protein product [Rotaria sp. Silwood2]